MFNIFIKEELIGCSSLESGDPPMGVAAGQFISKTSFPDLITWMLYLGGEQEDKFGCWRLSAGENTATVVDINELVISHVGVELTVVPELNEAWIEVIGIPYPQYEQLFPKHVEQYRKQFTKIDSTEPKQ